MRSVKRTPRQRNSDEPSNEAEILKALCGEIEAIRRDAEEPGPARTSANTEIESIGEIMPRAISTLERVLRSEAAAVAGDAELFTLDEVIPVPTRDTKCHGQALSEFECETENF